MSMESSHKDCVCVCVCVNIAKLTCKWSSRDGGSD